MVNSIRIPLPMKPFNIAPKIHCFHFAEAFKICSPINNAAASFMVLISVGWNNATQDP